MNKLREKYEKEIKKVLAEKLNTNNLMAVPSLKKIVVNVGIGEAVKNPDALNKVADFLSVITGQKCVFTKSKHAISNFGIRVGMKIGAKVTLRKKRMWDFFERFISVVLPRIKDFRGISRKSFDGFGNLSVGISDHTVFPEVDTSKVDKIRSLQVIIETSARNDRDSVMLLEELDVPFAKDSEIKAIKKMKEAMKEEEDKRSKSKTKLQTQIENKGDN